MIFGYKCDQQPPGLANLDLIMISFYFFLSLSASFGPACCHTFQRSSAVRHGIAVRHGFTAAKLSLEVLASLVRKQDTLDTATSWCNGSSFALNVRSSCGPFPWPHALKIRATWRGLLTSEYLPFSVSWGQALLQPMQSCTWAQDWHAQKLGNSTVQPTYIDIHIKVSSMVSGVWMQILFFVQFAWQNSRIGLPQKVQTATEIYWMLSIKALLPRMFSNNSPSAGCLTSYHRSR